MTLRFLNDPADPAFREVLRIYHASFDEASREPDERLYEELRSEYRLPFRFLTALANGRVVGFARFCAIPGMDAGFLLHIAVDESARGNGVGSQLLSAVLEELAPSPVLVEIDRIGRVRDWYDRHGFVPITETYHQPALHDHTESVPYALCASKPAGDRAQLVMDFYAQVWERRLPDLLVREALDGVEGARF